MTYSKAKLNNSGDKESPFSRQFWIEKLSDNVYPYGFHYTLNHSIQIYEDLMYYLIVYSHGQVGLHKILVSPTI
jgi:hypothetical protein